jgi:hypothetical protein
LGFHDAVERGVAEGLGKVTFQRRSIVFRLDRVKDISHKGLGEDGAAVVHQHVIDSLGGDTMRQAGGDNAADRGTRHHVEQISALPALCFDLGQQGERQDAANAAAVD